MYRVILGAAAVLLVATVPPGLANDLSGPAFSGGTTMVDWLNCRETTSEAVAACTRMLARNPKDVETYSKRGNAYYNKRDYDRARPF